MPQKTDHLAVLFADIAESTALYRRLGDMQALHVVNAVINELKAVLPAYQGWLVKTLGDAVMCLFPNAERAVEAAVAMQHAVAALTPAGEQMEIRIGLHTGPVVVGGEDVYGNTVNVAAYLADAATPGQILIAEATAKDIAKARRGTMTPVFDAMLKTALSKTAVYDVHWRDDLAERTQINLQIERSIPQDIGCLVLLMEGAEYRVDYWNSKLAIGRSPGSGIVVADAMVSRNHATVYVDRTQFYLADHSTNGSFVTRASGEEIHVVRREILLEVQGEIRPGHSRSGSGGPPIVFCHDRRSMYRL